MELNRTTHLAHGDTPLSRRTLLLGTALVAGAAATGSAGNAWSAPTPPGSAPLPLRALDHVVHPGALHSETDFERITAAVAGGVDPWPAAKRRLTANARSGLEFASPRPQAVLDRGGETNNVIELTYDSSAAYQTALRWRLGDGDDYGAKSATILDAWSSTLTELTGETFLIAGYEGARLANAAEMIRDRDDFDYDAYVTMMMDLFYPVVDSFLVDHNGTYDQHYPTSWDGPVLNTLMAIGISCDRADLVDRAATYYREGIGNACVAKAAPYLVDDKEGDQSLAQWVEVGRDQPHTMGGLGAMIELCEQAWHQGIDLYAHEDHRLMRGAQYVAKYNLGHDVPYHSHTIHLGGPDNWEGWETYTEPSSSGRGVQAAIWDRLVGHYEGRLGRQVPWISQMAAALRPDQGGGGDDTATAGYDQLGLTTLTCFGEI